MFLFIYLAGLICQSILVQSYISLVCLRETFFKALCFTFHRHFDIITLTEYLNHVIMMFQIMLKSVCSFVYCCQYFNKCLNCFRIWQSCSWWNLTRSFPSTVRQIQASRNFAYHSNASNQVKYQLNTVYTIGIIIIFSNYQ